MLEQNTFIVGIGPGNPDFLYPLAEKALRNSEVLIGGQRNLAKFASWGKETVNIGNNLAEITEYIRRNYQHKKMAVLASGDTGLFSIRKYLQNHLPEVNFTVLPGISSLQYFAARLNLDWNEIKIVTLHGQEQVNLKNLVSKNKYTLIFSGSKYTPAKIAALLGEISFANLKLTVGENLSYPEERISSGSPAEIEQGNFSSLSLVLVENPDVQKRLWPYSSPGLPDEIFVRDQIPMTKNEIRAVLSSKWRLTPHSKILEIGAGTGSCTVEMALTAYEGQVWSLEKNPAAVALCRQNLQRFALDNVILLEENAPAGIPAGLKFDLVFIGGSGGNLEEIIQVAAEQSSRIVISSVTVESTAEASQALDELGWQTEIVQISVVRTRPAGSKHLMQALNPVMIISGEKL